MKSFLLGLILFFLSISPVIGQKGTNPKQIDLVELLSSTNGIDELALIVDSLIDYGHLDDVRLAGQQIIQASQKLNYNLGEARGFLIVGRFHKIYHQHDSASYYLNRGLQLAPEDNPLIIGRLYRWKARIFDDQSVFDSSAYYFVKAQQFVEKSSDKKNLIQVLTDKAHMYNRMDDNSQGLAISKSALALSPESFYGKMDTYNALGSSYQKKEVYDSALLYYNKALDLARKYNSSRDLVTLLNNIAVVYEETDRFRKALDYYFQTLEMDIANEDTLGLTYSHMGPAITYFRMNELDSALYYAEKMLFFAKHLNAKQRMRNVYELLISIHREKGDLEEVVKYYDLFLAIKEDIMEDSKFRTIRELETRFETEKKEQQIASLEIENQNEELKRNIFAVSLALSVLLGGSVIWTLRFRMWKNQELREKEDMLHHQQVEQYKSELNIYTNRLVDKSTRVEELNLELEKVKEEISGSCPTYNGTIDHLMQSTILTSDEWVEFRKLFSQVYPGFFGSIRTKYPDLTETEERLLTLTKLNLSSREIASMLGISMDSVYKSRYRLCKKLDISSEEIETIVAALG